MLGTSKAKSLSGLDRSVAKYEAKLAKAANPSQRQYAASMLNMARQALDKSREGTPAVEPDGTDVVTLGAHEYMRR